MPPPSPVWAWDREKKGEKLFRDADLHDLRDTRTSRENYVAASVATGVKRNRKRVLLVRSEIVAVSLLEDVVDE